MSVKLFLIILFATSILNLEENSSIENSSSCFQNITGEVRDRSSQELLPKTKIILIDGSDNVIETVVVEKNATFSFEVDCNTSYRIKALKIGYKSQEKEFKTSKKKRKITRLLIILGSE